MALHAAAAADVTDMSLEQLLQINPVSRIRAIAEKAELRLVGVGQIDQGAQLFVDGFIILTRVARAPLRA